MPVDPLSIACKWCDAAAGKPCRWTRRGGSTGTSPESIMFHQLRVQEAKMSERFGSPEPEPEPEPAPRGPALAEAVAAVVDAWMAFRPGLIAQFEHIAPEVSDSLDALARAAGREVT